MNPEASDMARLSRLRQASVGAALVAVLVGAAASHATDRQVGTGPAGVRAGLPAGTTTRNPAGPTPRNPAGPTPLNPAGPTPLNPAGGFGGSHLRGGGARAFVGNDAFTRPRTFVSVVGDSSAPSSFAGSYYCGVHDRAFATEQFFADHLWSVDGIAPSEVGDLLIDGGGVLVFPGFPAP